jgi:decaprenylphospho-beta-D-ribofuranose 2-oxidase
MGHPVKKAIVSGWGRAPAEECFLYRPEKRREVGEILSGVDGSALARGLGRSYGDTAVNPGGALIGFERINRMIHFDDATGVLECEAGVSLAEIIDVFLPRGWFIPVTPGTKYVTVGGAIANDVHGKNHHRDGSFSNFVDRFTLLTPAGDLLTCTPTENADVFWATLGGIGLTGMILTATLRLLRVESAFARVDYVRAENLEALLDAFALLDANYKYSVAWVDCLSKGRKLGRSVLMLGEHLPAKEMPAGYSNPFAVSSRMSPNVSFNVPTLLQNRLTVGTFNSVFYAAHPSSERQIIDYGTYFYPLDRIGNWNRIYGKPGFTQYQATFPLKATEGLVKLMEKVSQSGRASFLAVLKRFGPGGKGLLSHPFEGHTLTLDFPYRSGLPEFLRECDELLLKYGARLYLAKDATMTAETFAAMYPMLPAFKEVRAKVDPQGKLSSRMAKRLKIVED